MNEALKNYVEREILPQYRLFDGAHSTEHVQSVIRRSLELAAQTGADADMAYTVAAYHDLGLRGPRETHHLLSGRLLADDPQLRQWFTEEQIKTMREAVEDHRASAGHAPRSLYGCIVADADRDMTPETVVRRCLQYGLAHFPRLSREEQYRRTAEHLQQKYSEQGYVRLWFRGSENERNLRRLRALLKNETAVRKLFDEAAASLSAYNDHIN